MAIEAYTQAAEVIRYPLHLGHYGSGHAVPGTIKSSAGIGALLAMGIGNTVRIQLKCGSGGRD